MHNISMGRLVVPHNPNWRNAFREEAQAVSTALRDISISLHHIGSTSIPNILAKPIIDLLGIVSRIEALDQNSNRIANIGYEIIGPHGIDGRRYFRKSNASGQKTHHLHVFAKGSEHIERHLAFRDYLRSHPEKAAEYSMLKARLTEGKKNSAERLCGWQGAVCHSNRKRGRKLVSPSEVDFLGGA